MSRPRHGWLLEQLPDALSDPDVPENLKDRYIDVPSFMRIFEDIANGVEDEIDSLGRYFDPNVAPADFVAWMGRWIGVDVATLSRARQMRLLAAAGHALPWRGTARGLRLLLEAFTGGRVEIDDSGGVFGPGEPVPERKSITVQLSSSGDLTNPDLFRLIRDEIPADAWLRLEVAGEVATEAEETDQDTPEDVT